MNTTKCPLTRILSQPIVLARLNFPMKKPNLNGNPSPTFWKKALTTINTSNLKMLGFIHKVLDTTKNKSFFLLTNHKNPRAQRIKAYFPFKIKHHIKSLDCQKLASFQAQNQQGFIEQRECMTKPHFFVHDERKKEWNSS